MFFAYLCHLSLANTSIFKYWLRDRLIGLCQYGLSLTVFKAGYELDIAA